MKVLLVEPPISPYDVPTGTFGLPPPHHLERLAGFVEDICEVRILDMRLDKDLLFELCNFKPNIVGVSSVVANNYLAKKVLQQTKDFNKDIITLIGGHHPSLAPHDCADTDIDFIIVGEGEATLREIILKAVDPKSWPTIKGIAYGKNAQTLIKTPCRDFLDFSLLPLPARHLTQKYREKKLYFRASWRPVDLIISSRGCPFQCKFCGIWKVHRRSYRHRDIVSVVDELETIKEPYVCFVDDNTLSHVQRAHELADEIKRRGIKKTYECYSRADTIVKNPDLIKKWRIIGMKLLLVGLESFDEKFLEMVNKNVSFETNKQAIKICHDLDIEMVSYLIVDQRFDKMDFKRLSDFVRVNKLTHPIFTILTPFPGTDLYEQVKDQLITDRKDIIDFYHTVLPTKLPLKEFYDEFFNLYQRAYPPSSFLSALFKRKAVLSPAMLKITLQVRKRMKNLYEHHRLAPVEL